MLLVDRSLPDPVEAISRELEFQKKRGFHPVAIEISPEVHELMRVRQHLPVGARLIDHDGIPVRINRHFIGPRSWVIRYRETTPLTERQIDMARSAG